VRAVSDALASTTPASVSSPSKSFTQTSTAPTPAAATSAPAASSPQNDGPAPPLYAAAGPEIIAGRYKIRSIGTGEYFGVPTARPLGLHSDGSEFTLTYTGKSNGELKLRYSAEDLVSLANAVIVSNRGDQWESWVLEHQTDRNGGYCYYICDSTDPRFVVSGDIEYIFGRDCLTVAKKRPGYEKHLWKFELIAAAASAAPAAFPATFAPVVSIPPYDAPPPARYSPNPYPEIAGGDYHVKNVGTGKYFHGKIEGTFPDIISVYYEGNSAELQLWSDRIPAVGSKHVIYETSPSYIQFRAGGEWLKWILERHTDRNGGYCYYICHSHYPQFVICGDKYAPAYGGEQFFLVEQKRPGYERHLWRFNKC